MIWVTLPTNSNHKSNVKSEMEQQQLRKGMAAGSSTSILLGVVALLQLTILVQMIGDPFHSASKMGTNVVTWQGQEDNDSKLKGTVYKQESHAIGVEDNEVEEESKEDSLWLNQDYGTEKLDLSNDELFLDFAAARFGGALRIHDDGENRQESLLTKVPKKISSIFNSSNSAGRRRPKAILHVGPRKTGSSSIQKALKQDAYGLSKHNFELFPHHHRLLALCLLMNDDFLENTIWAKECSDESDTIGEMQVRIANAYSQGKDVVVPSEALGKAKHVNITKIRQLFSDFDVHIVVVYRRYFEWIVSNINFLYAQKNRGESWPAEDTIDQNIVSLLTKEEIKNLYMRFSFLEVYRKYGQEKTFTMHKLNFQADKNIVKSFFCLGFFNNTRACNAESRQEHYRVNTARSVAYNHIAIAAKKAGLLEVHKNLTRREATVVLRSYFEDTLGLNEADLPKYCMEERELNLLKRISVLSETLAFPRFYNEEEFDSRLDIYSKTKLCSVNTTKVLDDHGHTIQSLLLEEYSPHG